MIDKKVFYKHFIFRVIEKLEEIKLDLEDNDTTELLSDMINNLGDYEGWYPETVLAEACFDVLKIMIEDEIILDKLSETSLWK